MKDKIDNFGRKLETIKRAPNGNKKYVITEIKNSVDRKDK